jgi:hypothetical protein
MTLESPYTADDSTESNGENVEQVVLGAFNPRIVE